jgi:hypothetical protein
MDKGDLIKSIQKFSIEPNDLLIITLAKHTTCEQAEDIYETIKKNIKESHVKNFLVIYEGIDIIKIDEINMEKLGWVKKE